MMNCIRPNTAKRPNNGSFLWFFEVMRNHKKSQFFFTFGNSHSLWDSLVGTPWIDAKKIPQQRWFQSRFIPIHSMFDWTSSTFCCCLKPFYISTFACKIAIFLPAQNHHHFFWLDQTFCCFNHIFCCLRRAISAMFAGEVINFSPWTTMLTLWETITYLWKLLTFHG